MLVSSAGLPVGTLFPMAAAIASTYQHHVPGQPNTCNSYSGVKNKARTGLSAEPSSVTVRAKAKKWSGVSEGTCYMISGETEAMLITSQTVPN